jgi:hypothetical protein
MEQMPPHDNNEDFDFNLELQPLDEKSSEYDHEMNLMEQTTPANPTSSEVQMSKAEDILGNDSELSLESDDEAEARVAQEKPGTFIDSRDQADPWKGAATGGSTRVNDAQEGDINEIIGQ